jgi:hypothetical protein
MSQKVMKLLNPSSGLMECRVCGRRHHASLVGNGHYRRGSWQCPNGCKRTDDPLPAPPAIGQHKARA